MSKKILEEDFIGAGFHRLDPKIVDLNNPPKIQWGDLHKGQTLEEQRDRAQKLAGAMNHAAFLIQGERDQMMKLFTHTGNLRWRIQRLHHKVAVAIEELLLVRGEKKQIVFHI